jgi:hypothetical protein
MSAMEPSATSWPPAADPSRTQTGADTDEPYVHRFKSVKMPGVAKGPILPESVSKFFRKRFRRKHTAATR